MDSTKVRAIIDQHKYVKKTIALEERYFANLNGSLRAVISTMKRHGALLTPAMAESFVKINGLVDQITTEIDAIDHAILKEAAANRQCTEYELQRLKIYNEVDDAFDDSNYVDMSTIMLGPADEQPVL